MATRTGPIEGLFDTDTGALLGLVQQGMSQRVPLQFAAAGRGGLLASPTCVLFGASLVSRTYVYDEFGGAAIQRLDGDLILVSRNPTLGPVPAPGELVSLRSRLEQFDTGIVPATIVSSSPTQVVFTLPAAVAGYPAQVHPGGNDALTQLVYMARYDTPGSDLRFACMVPALSGRLRVKHMLAQGGDNAPQVRAKLQRLLAACADVALEGGFCFGNLGGDPDLWNPLDEVPEGLRIIRAITATGCIYVSIEGSAGSPDEPPDSVDKRTGVQFIRALLEREAQRNPRFIPLDIGSALMDYTNPNGKARPGLHFDLVHRRQAGAAVAGGVIAPALQQLFPTLSVRAMRQSPSDIVVNGTANAGANVAGGLYAGSPTTPATMAPSQPGTTNISGTTDAIVNPITRTGTGTVDIAASFTNLPNGLRTIQFIVGKSAPGGATVTIPFRGPTADPWVNRMRAGEWEVGFAYEMDTPSGQVQALDIFADDGQGTILAAGSILQSPEYNTNLPNATMTVVENGRLWFPQPIRLLTNPTDFRILVRPVFVTGNAGQVTFRVLDLGVRLLRPL